MAGQESADVIHIADNLARVQEQIAAAARQAGRVASEITLVAVTKTRSPAEMRAAYAAGVRHLGENRVEEMAEKRPQLELEGVTWHMVGHLQRRKAGQAVELFDIVHSVDSVRLARRLDSLAAERGLVLPILIEVNVSGEESKYGFRLAEREALDAAVAEIVALSHLRVDGLMTVAFVARNPEEVRPVFVRLRQMRDELRARFPAGDWRHLSMGMTDDFGVAIQEGATMVRVGRAIFGPRAHAVGADAARIDAPSAG
jgi:pyridoxal phosphate enzyme (YggS family)